MGKNIYIGQKASILKIVSDEDVKQFAELTGDYNYLHLDLDRAKESMFGDRVCHGMLVNSYISTVLGTCLPGEGTIYLEQNTKFLQPVFLNEEITITVEVEYINKKNGIITLKTDITKEGNIAVVVGKAVVMCKDIIVCD